MVDRRFNMCLHRRLWPLVLLVLGIAVSLVPAAAPADQKQKDKTSTDFIFEAKPKEITAGESVVLRWSIKSATKVTIEEAAETRSGGVALKKLVAFEGSSGTLEVKPESTTSYVISCEGSTSFACASVTVRVNVREK